MPSSRRAPRRSDLDSTVAWEAVRKAGGSIPTAARVLGLSAVELIAILREDPPVRLGISPHGTSGLRRRVVDPPEGPESDDA